MHLLEINKENYIGQADPFIFEANVIWRRFYAEGNKLFYLFVVAFYLLFFFAFSAFIVWAVRANGIIYVKILINC